MSTNQIIKKALNDGKKVAVPRVIFGSNKMEFYYLKNMKGGTNHVKIFKIYES